MKKQTEKTRSGKTMQTASEINERLQEYTRLQGMMLYNMLVTKSMVVPLTHELMELNRIGMSIDPKGAMSDWAERQQSALKFQRFVETFGKVLFGSATYAGEKLLAENSLFRLTHIPVKAGVEKRASLFHVGGFVPYSDNLFRLLPKANFFDRFIENGIDVYEMKLKCSTTAPNPQLLELSIESIIDTVHEFSDLAFSHCGRKMILEGYCGTGINTYTSYLADIENMSRKFSMIVTFVSPLDARKCTIFEQLHEILEFLNPSSMSVDGLTISSLLDTIQERNFEKTPMGALVHGWKNKEYAHVEKIGDLSLRQQSELAAWYWLSLAHGAYYPLSKDLYQFYSRLFTFGVSRAGTLPYEYKGQALNLHDLKKTGIPVLAFLGDKDHLVDCRTADVLKDILGDQAEIVVHKKTGHVAYIFNPNRWKADDPRAFVPDVLESIFHKLPGDETPVRPAGKSERESATAAALATQKRKPAARAKAPVKATVSAAQTATRKASPEAKPAAAPVRKAATAKAPARKKPASS